MSSFPASLVFSLLLLAAAPARAAVASSAPVVGVGDAAPDFALPVLSGGTAALSSYRGKVVMLDFWYKKCFFCEQAHPSVVALYAEYKKSGKNVEFLGINVYDRDTAVIKEYVEKQGIKFPIWLDPGQVVLKQYAVRSAPTLI